MREFYESYGGGDQQNTAEELYKESGLPMTVFNGDQPETAGQIQEAPGRTNLKRKYTKKNKPPALNTSIDRVQFTPYMPLEPQFVETSNNTPSDSDMSDITSFLNEKFAEISIQFQASNALLRQSIVIAKATAQNIKVFCQQENIDFLDDIDISLPVQSAAELQDLEMRCLDPDFRRKLVSINT